MKNIIFILTTTFLLLISFITFNSCESTSPKQFPPPQGYTSWDEYYNVYSQQQTDLPVTEVPPAQTLTPAPEPAPEIKPVPTPTLETMEESEPTPPPKPTPDVAYTPKTTVPKLTLEDIVIKSSELPIGWQLVSSGKRGGIREWDINNAVAPPIDELEVVFQSSDEVSKVIKNYIIWCSKSDANYYYEQAKELKYSDAIITAFSIGDEGFFRVVYGPRLELNEITDIEQFKDIIIKYAAIYFIKEAFYVSITYGQIEVTSEKDALSFLQRLATSIESRIQVE